MADGLLRDTKLSYPDRGSALNRCLLCLRKTPAQPITLSGMHPVPDLDLFAFNFKVRIHLRRRTMNRNCAPLTTGLCRGHVAEYIFFFLAIGSIWP